MYCKECGSEISSGQSVCLKCGVPVGTGNHYCSNCGEEVPKNATVCAKCGLTLSVSKSKLKKKSVVLLLAILLGGFGVHNFYLGYNTNAVIQLVVSLVLFWTGIAPLAMYILAIVEGVKAYQGKLNDANGNALVD